MYNTFICETVEKENELAVDVPLSTVPLDSKLNITLKERSVSSENKYPIPDNAVSKIKNMEELISCSSRMKPERNDTFTECFVPEESDAKVSACQEENVQKESVLNVQTSSLITSNENVTGAEMNELQDTFDENDVTLETDMNNTFIYDTVEKENELAVDVQLSTVPLDSKLNTTLKECLVSSENKYPIPDNAVSKIKNGEELISCSSRMKPELNETFTECFVPEESDAKASAFQEENVQKERVFNVQTSSLITCNENGALAEINGLKETFGDNEVTVKTSMNNTFICDTVEKENDLAVDIPFSTNALDSKLNTTLKECSVSSENKYPIPDNAVSKIKNVEELISCSSRMKPELNETFTECFVPEESDAKVSAFQEENVQKESVFNVQNSSLITSNENGAVAETNGLKKTFDDNEVTVKTNMNNTFICETMEKENELATVPLDSNTNITLKERSVSSENEYTIPDNAVSRNENVEELISCSSRMKPELNETFTECFVPEESDAKVSVFQEENVQKESVFSGQTSSLITSNENVTQGESNGLKETFDMNEVTVKTNISNTFICETVEKENELAVDVPFSTVPLDSKLNTTLKECSVSSENQYPIPDNTVSKIENGEELISWSSNVKPELDETFTECCVPEKSDAKVSAFQEDNVQKESVFNVQTSSLITSNENVTGAETNELQDTFDKNDVTLETDMNNTFIYSTVEKENELAVDVPLSTVPLDSKLNTTLKECSVSSENKYPIPDNAVSKIENGEELISWSSNVKPELDETFTECFVPEESEAKDCEIQCFSNDGANSQIQDLNFVTSDEVFKDPSTFDFLTQFGNSQSLRDLRKESLYVKFDPLVGSPHSVARTNKIEFPLKVEDERKESKEVDVTARTDDLTESLESFFGTKLSLSCNDSKNNTLTCEQEVYKEELDSLKKTVSKLQEMLKKKDEDHKDEIAKYKHQIAKYENEIVSLKFTVVKKADQMEEIKHDLEENKKEKQELISVLKEFEKTLAQCIAEQKQTVSENNLLKIKLDTLKEDQEKKIKEKYEKMSHIVSKAKKNEKILCAKLEEYRQVLETEKENFQKLKEHAVDQLESANEKWCVEQTRHKLEIAKLTSTINDLERKVQSLQKELEQKTQENSQLMTMCDELVQQFER